MPMVEDGIWTKGNCPWVVEIPDRYLANIFWGLQIESYWELYWDI